MPTPHNQRNLREYLLPCPNHRYGNLSAGLIDELSVLIAPVADGGVGAPSLFDARRGSGVARRLKLLSAERRPGDLLWVRYRVGGGPRRH